MPRLYYIIIYLLFLIPGLHVVGQNSNVILVKIIKQNFSAKPGTVVNIALFVKNSSGDTLAIKNKVLKPEEWGLVTNINLETLLPHEQKFIVISTRIPARCEVGDYRVGIELFHDGSSSSVAEGTSIISVGEVENIALELIESDENIKAGDYYRAHFLVQNLGNSDKTVVIGTSNCDVDGDVHIPLKSGESAKVSVYKQTSDEIMASQKEYIRVTASLGGEVKDKIFRPFMVFPVKQIKKDLFFRYPVKASLTYLAANTDKVYRSAYEFEFSGKGSLDLAGKHYLEFMARGSNGNNMDYLGTYEQYYLGYKSRSLDLSIGQKAYQFTSLTESSRYGLGVETKVVLAKGLSAGFIYVKPSYYEEIEHEIAVFTQFEKNEKTKLALYLIKKENEGSVDPAYLFSFSSKLKPLKTTSLDMEFSRGLTGELAGNAYQVSINSQISIFSVNGAYYSVGDNYPGYYTNSKFYSGSLSARVSKKISAGLFVRRDFSNAQLDTFFVTAPYTKSEQYYFNYIIGPRTQFRVYWTTYERKDRLTEDKFDYETNSFNSQLTQKFNRFSYLVKGGYGTTTNFQLSADANKQNTYNLSVHGGFKFSTKFGVKVFGSYSNLNSFVSGEQRNATAGLSVSGRIKDRVRANLYLQNAYNIDDYYKNRNLMQFNFDYKISKNHKFSFRSYYTLFRSETESPDFFFSATYNCKFGVPLKQVKKAGDFSGRLQRDSGEVMEGVLVSLLNKSAITNDKGEFKFRSIPLGVYMLNIGRAKFNIDEMPDIPQPIKIEIIEDKETRLNIGITKGAKLKGMFVFKADSSSDNGFYSGEKPNLANIVMELSSELESFRIATDKDGSFSFPLVLPGLWHLKIFESSLPKGFVLKNKINRFTLKSGDQKDTVLVVYPKVRQIIFKSSGISLSNSGLGSLKSLKKSAQLTPEKSLPKNEIFYSVQIGAFAEKLSPDNFLLQGQRFDFEKQLNNLYKYFVGRFSTLEDAIKAGEELKKKFKGACVVSFKNDKLIYIDQ